MKDILPNIDSNRVEVTPRGWVIDGYYIVDWKASVYVITDNQDEDDYVRSGGEVKTVDKSHEFVELSLRGYSPERKKIKLNDETYILGEREMLFLSKVEWLLNRAKYHSDEPFWRFNEELRKKYLRGNKNE
jgi:hypothetical protein